MNVFQEFLTKTAEAIPDLLSVVLCPALLVAAALLLTLLRKKNAYLPTAVGLGGAGMFLVSAEVVGKDLSFAVAAAYLALFATLAALLSPLFLLTDGRKKETDADELYQKFHVALDEPEETESQTDDAYDAEDCGLRLTHATALLETLLKGEILPSDRLEAEEISRTLDKYRGRALSAEEIRSLNDCLSTVLKLTAKYKL